MLFDMLTVSSADFVSSNTETALTMISPSISSFPIIKMPFLVISVSGDVPMTDHLTSEIYSPLYNFVTCESKKDTVLKKPAKLTFYANTFVSTKNNKVLVKDNETSEERLIDCTKNSSEYKQLLSDLPYFKEGDPVKLQTKQRDKKLLM